MGGVFWSKLWSSQIWTFPKWGGYSGVNFGHLKSELFRNGGGFLVWNSRKGLSGKFGQKFTVQPETCLCITNSLSHTTYVETKQKKKTLQGYHISNYNIMTFPGFGTFSNIKNAFWMWHPSKTLSALYKIWIESTTQNKILTKCRYLIFEFITILKTLLN